MSLLTEKLIGNHSWDDKYLKKLLEKFFCNYSATLFTYLTERGEKPTVLLIRGKSRCMQFEKNTANAASNK